MTGVAVVTVLDVVTVDPRLVVVGVGMFICNGSSGCGVVDDSLTLLGAES